jgi:hypothetical protein
MNVNNDIVFHKVYRMTPGNEPVITIEKADKGF